MSRPVVLDRQSMEQMSQLIREIVPQVFCVIIVTHDDQLIESCCDRVIGLEDGTLTESYYVKTTEETLFVDEVTA